MKPHFASRDALPWHSLQSSVHQGRFTAERSNPYTYTVSVQYIQYSRYSIFFLVGCVVPDFHIKSLSNQCFLSSIPSTDQASSVGVARTQLAPMPSYYLSPQNLHTTNLTHIHTSAESRHASQHALVLHTINLTNFNTF